MLRFLIYSEANTFKTSMQIKKQNLTGYPRSPSICPTDTVGFLLFIVTKYR